jgi:predicted nucleotidyltransferase
MMDIQLVVRKLLEYDPEIVEIVQFGSSVYAPEHARDLDLLVITGRMEEYSGYLDAVADFNADIIVLEVGKIPEESLLRG